MCGKILQPVELFVVGKLEKKLVNNAIDANGATCKLQICIVRVIEDEIVPVEG